ncbi:P-loop containing nucleoside triphosphate hydrolase protein [Flammula alnicola]|nr:P-loop containing nucleoside triphosphate hydrolase protein [Flammula alnicola]
MAEFSPAALATLAKIQLGLPPTTPDHRVPIFYLEELRRHLMLYPHEDNFRVTLQPKVGCHRFVTCLEDNCNEVIPLIRRVRAHDGGKRDGLGSLSAYRNHLSSHNNRKTHVKADPDNDLPSLSHAQSSSLSKGAVMYKSPLSPKPQGPSSHLLASSRRKLEGATQPVSTVRVKPEVFEPTIPRKRLSDTAFTTKLKTEVIPKAPLAQVTNTPTASARTPQVVVPMYPPVDSFHDVQLKLEDNCSQPTRSYGDVQRITAVEGEIIRLQELERSYALMIGPTTPSHSQAFVENQPVVKQEFVANGAQNFANVWTPPAEDSKSNIIPRPFPMSLDRKPLINQHRPTASSSTAPWPDSTQYPASPPFPAQQKPLVYATNAAASSSKDPYLPSQGHKTKFSDPFDMDTGEDSDSARDSLSPPPNFANSFIDRIDYHGRGRDLFVGPRAAADDIEKFLIEAGNAESFDGNESVDKALHYLGMNNLHEKLPGMEVSLMPHQAMGVAWMLEKERSSLQGGCLADEMGLGKANELNHCPLALLNQWKLEIEDKTNCGFKCLIYHGPSKLRKKSDLMQYDVVLTTFNTMALEWPDYEMQMKKKAKAKKRKDDFIVDDSDEENMRDATYRSEKRKQQVIILYYAPFLVCLDWSPSLAGLLFQVEFFRIATDEGQNIRNRRTSKTPIVNTLADVYGYLRFLKVRPWYDWQKFHRDIGILEKKNPSLAIARLQKVMTTFLLRRKKDSKLDGKNLIELPEKEVLLRKLEFSEEERDIYSMFNRYLRAGTVLKYAYIKMLTASRRNYHQVLVLLLRLRQICSHASLIQEDGVAFVHPDEADVSPEFATELTRARRLVSSEFVAKMKEKFKQDALARMEAEKRSASATVEEEDCPICYDAMTDAVVTACTHIFCRDCIADHAPGGNANDRSCPVCRSAINMEKLFSRAAFAPSDKDINPLVDDDYDMDVIDLPAKNSQGKQKSGKQTRKTGRAVRRPFRESDDEGDDVFDSGSDEDEDDNDNDDLSDFIVESDEDEEKDARRSIKKRLGKKRANVILDSDDEPDTPEEKEVIFGIRKKMPVSKDAIKLMPRFLPSTKMKYMMDQLKKLSKTNPEEKTLIVSQWTGCLSLVSDYLTENGIPHVKYQGDMNRAKRDQAVQVFMSRDKARVMLMSLKCGGVGLNLTRANNVISLDLGWSLAVESQAYDRVHRLGQARKVTVQRVVIADTVEDRILHMQERKQALAEGSLGEGAGKKIGTNLFGLDARGRRLLN